MAISPSFTVAQNPTTPSVVVVADTSTGSDVAIASRRVYFRDYLGNYLVPSGVTTDYVPWPLVDTTISCNILDQDMALFITVEWVNVSGNVLYTDSNYFCLTCYSKSFLYNLVQQQGLPNTPPITSDLLYNSNLAITWTNLRGAINAVEFAQDLSGSQNCLNQIQFFIENQTTFF